MSNDRLTIDPGNNRAVVVEGSLHVMGKVTVDSTPADGKGVTDLGKELKMCKAGQRLLAEDHAALQHDHAALQAEVDALAKRFAALEHKVSKLK